MKKILLTLLLATATAFAQKSNDKDTQVQLVNEQNAEKITFMLNTEWFVKDPATVYGYKTTDDKVFIRVMNASYMDFPVALENLNKKYGTDNVSLLVEDKIMKGRRMQGGPPDTGSLFYGINSGDGRLISVMVYLPLSQLDEWEPYIDNVMKTFEISML